MWLSVQVLVYCLVCCELVNCFKFPFPNNWFGKHDHKDENDHTHRPEQFGISRHQGEQSEISNSMPSKVCSHSNSNKQIPMSLLREINGVASLDEFMNRYVDGPTDSISIASRFGESEERSNSQLLLHAGCSPEFVTVPIEVDGLDSNTIIHPSCVRIERCGGCCDAVSDCQPTSTGKEMVSAIVKVFKYNHDTGKFGFERNEIVPLERHTKCECGCKLKSEHCLSYQKYHVEDCACRCNNTDEEEKCELHGKKIWDADTCTCSCLQDEDCATGYFFDTNSCECMDETLTTRRPVNDGPKSAAENERIRQERNKLKVRPSIT